MSRHSITFRSANRGALMSPERKPRAQGPGLRLMRTSRDQGALDAPILSHSRNAQNCYLAMAAMRPDRRGLEPTAGTCHDADSPRTVAMTILPTQGLAAGSVPANHRETKKAPVSQTGALGR